MENDLIGRSIGPYEIVEFLGAEGVLEIYLGHHPELDRPVIIRIAGRFLEDDPVFSTRFRREAKAIARLRHANVARLYDFGAVQGGHYMVTDHVEGIPLAELIGEARAGERLIEAEDITFIVRQIAAALEHAHSGGVTHGELTPANVILTRSGQAIVDGFGLALLRSREAGDQVAHVDLGLFEYLAPEQIHDPRAATPASDVYSLGVVLYELATGELPFEAGSDIDAILRSLHDTAPDPRYLNPDLPPAVTQVILKALAKSPRERFTNAMQVASALEWAYAHPGEEALPRPSSDATQVGMPTQALHDVRAPTERIVIKRRPSRREERRDKRRLREEHKRIEKVEEAERQRIERARQQAERLTQQQLRRERRRTFFSAWGRSFVMLIVTLLLLAAVGYLLQTVGILSVAVALPTLPSRAGEATATHTPTSTPTPTNTPTPTITPSPTPLQSAAATPVPPLQFTPLEVGTGAYRIHDGGVFQFIPAGRFLMGTDDPNRKSADRPQHAVMLTDYWLDRTEVTNAQYYICVEAGFCQPPRDTIYFDNPDYADFPVTYVNYESAAAYCLWLAGQANQVIGLPTEAQWEKAAAWDPVEGLARLFPWGNEPATPDRLSFVESGAVRPASPVGSHPAGASAYGVLDMAGNVWEWVADWFDSDYYKRTGISLDPTGPITGSTRVTRGGSWTREAGLAISSFRNPVRPTTSSNEIGFRCAMSAERPPVESGILLAPVDVMEALGGLVEAAKEGLDEEYPPAVAEEMEGDLDDWIEALEKIGTALKSGDNAVALSLIERRLARFEAQDEPLPFSDQLAWQIERGLVWAQEQLGAQLPPPDEQTETITPTPE